MRNTRVFTNQALSPGLEITLDDVTSRHLGTVLRLTTGDPVVLFNGQGGEFKAAIRGSNKKKLTVLVSDYLEINRESPLRIHLGIGLSRGDRMDWVIQKATEVGVTEITPLITQRTEVKLVENRIQNKLSHWQKICISACEQSYRTKVPQIHLPIKINQWTANVKSEKKLVLHHRGDNTISAIREEKISSVSLLVGPEGGLTEEEIQASAHKNFEQLALGPRVLRTETAPIAAISIIQSIWGDFS
ncbi:MAG: 16S rRNA (uracil1498-N3)-methyltransferase [Porticoccus sp.]|jgi:16S rRNA (uracil1498-N3)-methyltransferase